MCITCISASNRHGTSITASRTSRNVSFLIALISLSTAQTSCAAALFRLTNASRAFFSIACAFSAISSSRNGMSSGGSANKARPRSAMCAARSAMRSKSRSILSAAMM